MTQPLSSPGEPLRFSVVIPTFQRRNLVLAAVRSLARQEFPSRFEVIVVVDGSTDGTAEALKALNPGIPLAVLEQPNRGASAARNHGAASARGEILLFLDDDMEAAPRLLAELDRSHQDGADVVFGHLPLHPDSPANFLSAEVKNWTDDRLRRLTSPGERLTLHDLLTGQMSIARALFERVGGFDTKFTRDGTFGNEDVDFGYRLLSAGYRLVFNPLAISHQHYIVQPAQHLRQWRQAGQADVRFARKHPEQAAALFALNGADELINRLLWRSLAAMSPLTRPLMNVMRWLALRWVERPKPSSPAVRFYFQVHAMEYWRGVHESGGVPRPRPLRVLAYHSIDDLADAAVIGPYGVPIDQLCWQLDALLRWGFSFVSPDEFICFLRRGGGVPSRPVLLTFDDAYRNLRDVVPSLEARGIRAVVFAVSRRLGESNTWDQVLGAPQLELLDAADLSALAARGVEVGTHSRTHRPLAGLPDEALIDEIAGSVTDLKAIGVHRPRMFAYPEGSYDRRAKSQARAAGLEAAFAVFADLVRPGQDPYEVPRIEILRADRSWRFLWKVIAAGRFTRNRVESHDT